MEQVGRYRIESQIGEGAMADVYRALDPDIGRVVAIKVLKPELRRDPVLVARFLTEARAAGSLSHSGIATVYDVGEADGYPYIAMEFVAGTPLDTVMEQSGRMVSERVIAIGLQVASALDYAHEKGVVHRDIKPSNIMLGRDGVSVKLLDFGIARIADGDDAYAARTQAGQVVGTPRYMSPEQALGLATDHRTDLFSLGIVLYELVTGRAAFGGGGLATVALQVTQRHPDPIGQVTPDCPRGLRTIIERLLCKQREQRFATAQQLCEALTRERDDAIGDRPDRRRRLALGIVMPAALSLAVAALLVLCVGTVLGRQERTLERMALSSGSSIMAFVAGNSALHIADNASLPAEEQDWLPLQSFAQAAAEDRNVERLVIVDNAGIVRAANEAALIGTRYRPVRGEAAPVSSPVGSTPAGADTIGVSSDPRAPGFRFSRPILYAGKQFGRVEMIFGRGGLDAAIVSTRNWLILLSVVVTLAIFMMLMASAQLMARPLRQLRRGLDEAASGNTHFRLPHDKGGEIGALFGAFNRLSARIAERGDAPVAAESLTETVILDRAPASPASRMAA